MLIILLTMTNERNQRQPPQDQTGGREKGRNLFRKSFSAPPLLLFGLVSDGGVTVNIVDM